MRLFVTLSTWHRPSINNVQNLSSVYAAKDSAQAIHLHTKHGDFKWPNHLHQSSGLTCTDITDIAREFVRKHG